jgi:hypothetical protein
MKALATAALVLHFFWTTAARAQPVYPEHPVAVRVTGTLLPYEWPGREDLVTVGIYVQGQPWLLRLGEVEGLTLQQRERAVGEDVLLRWVRFYGDDELIAKLRDPKSVGKVFVIEGRLDTRRRRFLVTAVREAEAREPGEPH